MIVLVSSAKSTILELKAYVIYWDLYPNLYLIN